MSEYRAGQRVRIEGKTWAVEGEVKARGGDMALTVTSPHAYYDLALCEQASGVTVTVLSEPRPEEPTGLGAVVESSWRKFGNGRRRWVRNQAGGWTDEDGCCTYPWSDLFDPVVLHEGWVAP